MPSKTRNKRKVKRKVKGKSKQARRQLQNTRDSGALNWYKRARLRIRRSKRITPGITPQTQTKRPVKKRRNSLSLFSVSTTKSKTKINPESRI